MRRRAEWGSTSALGIHPFESTLNARKVPEPSLGDLAQDGIASCLCLSPPFPVPSPPHGLTRINMIDRHNVTCASAQNILLVKYPAYEAPPPLQPLLHE